MIESMKISRPICPLCKKEIIYPDIVHARRGKALHCSCVQRKRAEGIQKRQVLRAIAQGESESK